MYWYQLIILYLRPGLKPKPWYLHVTSFILKYVVTKTRPKVGDSLKTVLDIIFKGLQQQYPVLLCNEKNAIKVYVRHNLAIFLIFCFFVNHIVMHMPVNSILEVDVM